jgi:hypothetical protein
MASGLQIDEDTCPASPDPYSVPRQWLFINGHQAQWLPRAAEQARFVNNKSNRFIHHNEGYRFSQVFMVNTAKILVQFIASLQNCRWRMR